MRSHRKILNGWVVHAPLWHTLPSSVKWYGIYGSMYYIDGTVERVMFDYPETAKHFYYLRCTSCYNYDIYFATYSVTEMREFIRNMSWTDRNKKWGLYVEDAVTKKEYKGDEFVKKFMGGRQ